MCQILERSGDIIRDCLQPRPKEGGLLKYIYTLVLHIYIYIQTRHISDVDYSHNIVITSVYYINILHTPFKCQIHVVFDWIFSQIILPGNCQVFCIKTNIILPNLIKNFKILSCVQYCVRFCTM